MTSTLSARATAGVRRDLGRLVALDRVITEPAALFGYSYDSTTVLRGTSPLAVVQPAETSQVAAVLRYANAHDLPIIPRGSGTGLSGGCVPLGHELVLDLSRINRLRAVETTRRRAIAEPGVLTGDLLAAVEPAGLFYPPDPSSLKVSSLGGNVAENAGGPRGLKYGVTQDYVQALEVVLIDGEVLDLRREEDWDALALFVGSEGTLGAITLVEVRLIPMPPARRALLAVFPQLEAATRTVSIILREGITPSLIELMDDIAIRCVESYRGLGLPLDVEAILLIETDGDKSEANRDAARVRDLCEAAGAREVRIAATAEEAEALWTARRSITGALGRVRPDKIGEDICVPRPAIPAMARRVKEIGREFGVPVVLFGHAGDGNLHPNVLFSSLDADERQRGEAAADAIIAAATELGGVISGEHGVGIMKRKFMSLNVDSATMGLMRTFKQAVDPKGLLNPGKLLT
ncbi:MAG: glycolate oxidase subunit GlcD [Dehalococcoidia bacterium]|nr:glycolate oxidase subunit GlcD [Dehalococcoidia bacterium]